MEGNRASVVVISRNFATGLSIIRSLGAAGYVVDFVLGTDERESADFVAASRYIRDFSKVVIKKRGGDRMLKEALLTCAKKYREKVVLIPADMYTARVIDLHKAELCEYYIIPQTTEGNISEYSDINLQIKYAEAAGLNVSYEFLIAPEANAEIPENVAYPCVCRPLEDYKIKRRNVICSDKYELQNQIDYLRRRVPGCTIAIREYYEVDSIITIPGVCCGEKIYCPAYIKSTNIAEYKSRSILTGVLHDINDLSEVKTAIVKFLKSFNYTGPFNLKLRMDEKNIYFDRLLFSSGRQSYVCCCGGANLMEATVKAMIGEEFIPDKVDVVFGTRSINDMAAWEDYIRGHITKKELKEFLSKAEIKLISNHLDPAPGKLFLRNMEKAVRAKRLEKFKREFICKFTYKVRKKITPHLVKIKNYLLGYPQSKAKNKRNPLSDKPRVLVAGRNYSSNLCMARAVGMAGYEVEVFRLFKVLPEFGTIRRYLKPDAYSKYVKAFHVCVSLNKNQIIFEKLLAIADKRKRMLLIPTDDLVADVIDEHYKKLQKYYILPNVHGISGEVGRLMSKDVQGSLARAAGLPVINSCLITVKHGKKPIIPGSVIYPCFVKPNISKNSSKGKMRRCNNETDLRRTLRRYAREGDVEMVCQEFVAIEKEYSILGVSTKDGAIGPGFFCADAGGHGGRRGVALMGRVLPLDKYKELIDKVVSFVGSLGYEGLFDVDLIEDKNGKFYFVELNLRFGGSGYAITASGLNLPGMYADYAVFGKPIDMNAKIERPGKSFLNERVALGEYLGGFITYKDIKAAEKKADICFIKNDEDPKPYRHFKKFCILSAIEKFKFRSKRWFRKRHS